MASCTPPLLVRISLIVPLVTTIPSNLAIFRLEAPSNNAVQPVSKSLGVFITPSGLRKVHQRITDVFLASHELAARWRTTSTVLSREIISYSLGDVLVVGSIVQAGMGLGRVRIHTFLMEIVVIRSSCSWMEGCDSCL